jgi:hypothetical protein
MTGAVLTSNQMQSRHGPVQPPRVLADARLRVTTTVDSVGSDAKPRQKVAELTAHGPQKTHEPGTEPA